MANIVRPSEMEKTRLWLHDSLLASTAGGAARFPVSFDYGERPSASLLGSWTARREPAGTQPGATCETITLTDPETGLECRCEITVCADFPAVEWVAWQYDRPDLGEGMLVAFRRFASPFAACRLILQGLDPEAAYEVCSHDDGSTWRMDGRSLLDKGLAIDIADRPGSALFVYKRLA